MPIAGFTRFRSHGFGKQTTHGTPVVATRRVGWRGTPTINPNWTDQLDVDTGSVDPVLPPYRTQLDVSVSGLGGPLTYDDIPLTQAAAVRGGISATGATAKTWTHQALSLTATTLDEFTDFWSDDVTDDGIRLSDGVIESVTYAFDESLGPWTVSADWRFGAAATRMTPTAGLQVGSNLPLVFGADTALYIDSTAAGIGGTQISNALHRGTITIANTIDQKRFASGSNSRFAINSYGLADRQITFSFTFAKTTDIYGASGAATGEVGDWISATPVINYFSVVATSPEVIPGTATAYSWTQNFSGTWRMRTDEDLGGNSVITLEGTGRYDSTLGYAYKSVAVTSRATLP